MNLIKRIGITSSLFILSLSACSQNNSLPISNKKFAFKSFEEVSVEEGLYGSPSELIGANKDDLASKIKSGIGKTAGALVVSDTPITNIKYNGAVVNAYAVNESQNQYYFFVTKGAEENSYKFIGPDGNNPLEYKDYVYSLGTKSGSSTHSGVTYSYRYEASVSFESVTYNKEEESILTKIKVTEESTINDESSSKSGTFNVTWKV